MRFKVLAAIPNAVIPLSLFSVLSFSLSVARSAARRFFRFTPQPIGLPIHPLQVHLPDVS